MTPRTILITGATSGLGRAVATDLAAAGHRLIVHGRDPGKVTGRFYDVQKQSRARPEAYDPAFRAALRRVTDELVP